MALESRQILFAMACGCFIGGVATQTIGHSLNYHYFWSVGALAGGLIAWALADPAHLRAGAARAWQESLDGFRAAYDDAVHWHPNRHYWRVHLRRWWLLRLVQVRNAFAATAIITLSLGAALLTMNLFLYGLNLHYPIFLTKVTVGTVIWGTCVQSAVCSAIGFLFGFVGLLPQGANRLSRRSFKNLAETFWECAKYSNPVGFVILIAKGIRKVAPAIKLAAEIVVMLLWISMCAATYFIGYTIAYVHDERRTICLVDTTLVVAATYLSLNSVLAVLAAVVLGPIVGLANYELVNPLLRRIQAA